MSSLIGAVVTPVAAQELINRAGWRWTFVIFGGVGVVWAIAFHRWFRDDPAAHPDVNQLELDHIIAGREGEPAGQTHLPIPWRAVFRSANVWLLGFTTSCSAFASYLYFSWYPKYLEDARGLTPDQGKWLTAMVLGGGAVGCLIGGYLGRDVVRRTGDRRWSRRILGSGGLALAAAGLAASVQMDHPFAAALCTAFASLTASITLASWWAVVTDICGPHLGALFGLMNSMGVIGAVGSQVFFGRMSDYMKSLGHEGRARYDPAFYIYSGVLIAGAVGWLFIDSTRPVIPKEKEI